MLLYYLDNQKNANEKVYIIKKLPDYYHTRCMLPISENKEGFIKNPVDPDVINFAQLDTLKKKEFAIFEQMGHGSSRKNLCIEKTWYSMWIAYLNGDKYPGIIKTSQLINKQGKFKENLYEDIDYISVNQEQYNYLKEIYLSEGEIERPQSSYHRRARSSNNNHTKSYTVNTDNSHIDSDHQGYEIVTLMDENICPASEIKLSETETIPAQSARIMKRKFGLENPGLYCYLNATLQCLLSIQPIVDYFLTLQSKLNPQKHPYTLHIKSLICAISENDSKILKPTELWKEVSKSFTATSQHDFNEFFRYLLSKLNYESPTKPSIYEKLFKGTIKSTIKCAFCNHKSIKIEEIWDVSVEFSPSLKSSLKNFTKNEDIEFYCDSCKKNRRASKQLQFINTPKVLIVQLKRFKSQPRTYKINDYCKFHKHLSLSNEIGKDKYQLICVAEHKGSLNYGHYNAYCKRVNRWYKFNDAKFDKIPLANVLNKKIYCAVFSKD